MIICIGPICIPVWGLLPFLLAILAQAKDAILVFFGFRKPQVVVVHHAPKKNLSENNNNNAMAARNDDDDAKKTKKDDDDFTSTTTTASESAFSVVEPHTTEEFDQALLLKSLAIVDFSATWCGPCKKVAPVFAEECQLRGDVMTFIKVDVDELDMVASRFKVSSLPCFVLLQDGKELARELGGGNEAVLRSFIHHHVMEE